MSNLSVKRQRANTNGDAAAIISKSPDEYRQIIATFDETTLRDLLLSAATHSSQVAALVVARRYEVIKTGKAKAIDDRAQEPEMDLATAKKVMPANEARKSKEANVPARDM